MKINLRKPNRSSPYYQLMFEDVDGFSTYRNVIQDKNKKAKGFPLMVGGVDIGFTRNQLRELKKVLDEEISRWRK